MTTAADITALADASVAQGTVSREQADQWVAADVASLDQPVDAHLATVDKPAAAPVAEPSAPVAPKQVQTAEEAGIRAMADAMVEKGHITHEQADKMISDEINAMNGEDSTAQQAPARPEVLTEINQLDAGCDRPDSPNQYQLGIPKLPTMGVPELAEVQGIFYDAHMPRSVAETIWPEIEKLAIKPVSNDDLILMNASTHAFLERTFGKEKDEMLVYGCRLMNELYAKHPDLKDVMERTGAGSHPVVVAQICGHGARLYRKG